MLKCREGQSVRSPQECLKHSPHWASELNQSLWCVVRRGSALSRTFTLSPSPYSLAAPGKRVLKLSCLVTMETSNFFSLPHNKPSVYVRVVIWLIDCCMFFSSLRNFSAFFCSNVTVGKVTKSLIFNTKIHLKSKKKCPDGHWISLL